MATPSMWSCMVSSMFQSRVYDTPCNERTAVSDVTVKKRIEAPAETVFEALTDFAQAADRIENVQRIEMLTDGPVGVGTRFRETRLLFEREATEELEITAFDPPRSYTIGCENHGCRFRSEFRLTPSGSGTEIEMIFEATPLTATAKLLAAAMQPMIGKVAEICGKDLDDLKAAIEGK